MTEERPDYKLGHSKNKSSLASVVPYHEVYPKIPDSVFLADRARISGDVILGKNVSV